MFHFIDVYEYLRELAPPIRWWRRRQLESSFQSLIPSLDRFNICHIIQNIQMWLRGVANLSTHVFICGLPEERFFAIFFNRSNVSCWRQSLRQECLIDEQRSIYDMNRREENFFFFLSLSSLSSLFSST